LTLDTLFLSCLLDESLFEFKGDEDFEELVNRINKIPSSKQKYISLVLINIIGDRFAFDTYTTIYMIGTKSSTDFDDLPPIPPTKSSFSFANHDLHLFLYFIKKTNITLFQEIYTFCEKDSNKFINKIGCRPNIKLIDIPKLFFLFVIIVALAILVWGCNSAAY